MKQGWMQSGQCQCDGWWEEGRGNGGRPAVYGMMTELIAVGEGKLMEASGRQQWCWERCL